MILSGLAVRQLRESKRIGPLAKELLAGTLSLAPATLALRGSSLAAYHGAEHITIGTYEHDEPRGKEHERCGSHLVGPLLLTSAVGAALAARAPAALRGVARAVALVGAIAAATELFGWMVRHPEHPVAKALARPGHELQHASRPPTPTRRSSRSPRLRSQPVSSWRRMALNTRTEGRRLPPEIFDLPVEKMREGYYTDAYFNHTRAALLADGRHPRVVMQVFQKHHAVLGGMDEAIAILKLCSEDWEALTVHALYDGDRIEPWETVMTIEGDYTLFAHLETVYLGVARAADADLDERHARARGGERKADHLHAGAPRSPPRADG